MDVKTIVAGMLAASLAATLSDCAYANSDTLSDADLAARASAVLPVPQTPTDRILGTHHGMPVVVEDRCGDVCPVYTVRIIHYLAETGATCTKLGGDVASIVIPVSIAVRTQDFCIPHVLYQRKLYTSHPYQK